MKIQLDHIGIAIDTSGKLSELLKILGLVVEHAEDVPSQKVITHFLPLPIGVTNLELLEPTSSDSTIAKFLTKNGPGIHHLSFRVDKGCLDSLCEKVSKAGYRFTYASPQQGAHGMRVNFIHPADAGGVLVELMEESAFS